jgi:hypothetical protein
MKTITRTSILMLLAAFLARAQDDTLTTCQGEVSEDSVYMAKIHPAMPELRFHTIVRDNPCFTLIITRDGQPDTLQLVQQPLGSPFHGDGVYTVFFQLVDVNYDGYKDLQLFKQKSDPFNTFFSFWTFNPKKGRFEYDAVLSDQVGCNPFIHSDVRTITHTSVGPPESYTWQKHRFTRGKYVLVEEETQNVAHDQPNSEGKYLYIRTFKQLKGGSLRIVKQIKGTLEQIQNKWYKNPKYWEAEEAERDARGGA